MQKAHNTRAGRGGRVRKPLSPPPSSAPTAPIGALSPETRPVTKIPKDREIEIEPRPLRRERTETTTTTTTERRTKKKKGAAGITAHYDTNKNTKHRQRRLRRARRCYLSPSIRFASGDCVFTLPPPPNESLAESIGEHPGLALRARRQRPAVVLLPLIGIRGPWTLRAPAPPFSSCRP